MLSAAYFAARFLWAPLLACWAAAKGVKARHAMWLPIGAGILATLWELAVPATANIRIDLLLVGPALMFADGLGGILLAVAAYRERKASGRFHPAIAAAAGLCLAAFAFFAATWAWSSWKAESEYREHVDGARLYYEAAFRDDETQRAAFGDLEGTRWAGYYVSDPPQPSFAHLVVNAAGDYFVFSTDFHERRGRTKPDSADAALASGNGIYLGLPTRSAVELRDLGGGKLQFRLREGNVSEMTFMKRPPPRFPVKPSAADEVRFMGVYAGVPEEGPRQQSVAQLWLWASEGRLWGVWLRGSYSRDKEQPVSGNARTEVSCGDEDCSTLLVEADGRRETVTRQGSNLLVWWIRKDQGIPLKRGEIVTGLPYAWAPLTSMEDNRKWLRSMHPDITWKAPAK